MQVQLWNSFSCNNSSDYRLVARFADPVIAARMGDRLRTFFAAYGAEWDQYLEDHDYSIPEDAPLPSAEALAKELKFEWNASDILSWGDEGLDGNEPDVAVIGTTLAIYHDYCGGFSDNLEAALANAGGTVEPTESKPPDISVRFTLPDGDAGERMANQLATFFAQKSTHDYFSDFTEPPWGMGRLHGDPGGIFWYRDGQQFGFKMPLSPRSYDDLRAYLAPVRDLDLRLCDEQELAAFEMRDVLAELEALAGSTITELDLRARGLRFLPRQLLALTSLTKLVLDGNPLATLSEDIAALSALTELSIDGCELTKLPDALAQLPLHSLDLTNNKLTAVPPVLARIPTLRVLKLRQMQPGADVSLLAQLPQLEVLDLGYLRPSGKGVRPFPSELLALTNLRELNLAYGAFAGIPDELANLAKLESLNLEAVLGHNTTLPPLHRLPALTTLEMNGNAGNSGKYPPHSVLDGVWKITTLRKLGIDRYGEQKNERPSLTKLPDDAFASMPHLRELDVSFTKLVTLPASLFELRELETVNLQYTALDRPTLDKLRSVFPRVRFDLRNVPTKVDVDDPHWRAVHAKVKEGAQKQRNNRAGAVADFEAALAMCRTGTMFSDYDELYATYGCVDAIGHLRNAATGAERERLGDRLIAHAERALELVPSGPIFHFTDEGAFQEEVIRRAGNALAWMLMERGDLERALQVVERALSVGGERSYVFDTKVRILLAANRPDEAYPIVDAILTEDPAFGDFQDLKTSPAFVEWKRTRRR